MTTPLAEQTVGVIGLGVMGGSLAGALSGLDPPPHIVGFAEAQGDRTAALAQGYVHESLPSAAAVAEVADTIVYCTPLGATLELLASHRHLWKSDAVVTDVASLKLPLQQSPEAVEGDRYVGSHPMAGAEGSGFAAATKELYRGTPVWLVMGQASARARSRISDMWEAVGAVPRETEATVHDRLMLKVSHVPQVTANALATLLADAGVGQAQLGPGARDMTRLAASSPEMWMDLFRLAGPELPLTVRALGAELERLASTLDRGDMREMEAIMRRTQAWRRAE